jgi:hypothetical protein
MSDWHQVAEDPTAFLQLGIASPQWVGHCVEDLCLAADAASYSGSAFLHMDLRSDNMCLLGQRVVLVDRNWAVRGPTEPSVLVALFAARRRTVARNRRARPRHVRGGHCQLFRNQRRLAAGAGLAESASRPARPVEDCAVLGLPRTRTPATGTVTARAVHRRSRRRFRSEARNRSSERRTRREMPMVGQCSCRVEAG